MGDLDFRRSVKVTAFSYGRQLLFEQHVKCQASGPHGSRANAPVSKSLSGCFQPNSFHEVFDTEKGAESEFYFLHACNADCGAVYRPLRLSCEFGQGCIVWFTIEQGRNQPSLLTTPDRSQVLLDALEQHKKPISKFSAQVEKRRYLLTATSALLRSINFTNLQVHQHDRRGSVGLVDF